ncbi:MAG: Amuc_1098 family type IV pilus outer membrane protein [Verrucomicrobiota bacterium]
MLVTVGLIASLTAGEPAKHGDSATQKLTAIRKLTSAASEEARELLRKGDQAYQAERYAQAVEAYAGAREMIPEVPATTELRAAATERYAQAAVEQARELSRQGDIAGAKATMDKVLSPNAAPNDPAARALRAQLDDPIRTNPALTAEHTKDVDAVRRLLYTAEGASNLGKFDEAKKHYEDVLRIDPSNTAARRGMEQVTAAERGYHNAAYDQTRAQMLSQVDAAWELQAKAPELGAGPGEPGGAPVGSGHVTLAAKLDHILIPKIALDQATLEEALDFLRVRALEGDTMETDPARKGVNFTVNLGPPESAAAQQIRALRFDLRLTQVPLSGVLKHLTELTHTAFTTDEFAVLITPLGVTSEELISRIYHVSPDFISSLNSGNGPAAAKEDPFAKAPAKDGLITTRLSAQDAFIKQGVTFPSGAAASYNAATNSLRVINTAANQDIISQIVEAMTQTEPVMVSVRVTMIKTQQTNLKELGFDWLVSPVSLNSNNSLFASGGTVGNTGGRTGADFISPVNYTTIPGVPADPTAAVNPGVVTNGLRSGDTAIGSNSIDQMLTDTNSSSQQKSVAPGVLAVTGLFSDNQVQMVMRGLDQKKSVDIMAQPSIVTRSGQASKVEILREFIYPTEYEPPQVPQTATSGAAMPVTPATPTAFQKRDVGIVLEVLPVADAAKRAIDITLNPSFSSFDGFVNYGSPISTTERNALGIQTTVVLTANQILMPIFNTQKLATQLTVADGATIVVGGLMQESVQSVQDQVPLFGSIPVLGRFFQSAAKQPVTTAIIFLVHVELLDPTGHPYRER